MKKPETEITCPFCEQGVLRKRKCGSCAKAYLQCDECEAVYRSAQELDEELGSSCPHCGADIGD